MSNKIKGNEYTLSKIFSSDFEYHIPGYQRPYAWTAVETGILFDDLYDLDKGLHKLPDNYRVPLVMYYYVGFSIKEIAQQLDVSTNTIKIRLSRGRKKLRTYLKETW